MTWPMTAGDIKHCPGTRVSLSSVRTAQSQDQSFKERRRGKDTDEDEEEEILGLSFQFSPLPSIPSQARPIPATMRSVTYPIKNAHSLFLTMIVYLLGLALLANTGTLASYAPVCPQLTVELRTSPNGRNGMPHPTVRAGARIKVLVRVTNHGPTDLINDLMVGVALPNFLQPLKAVARPRLRNKTLPLVVDRQDTYWVGLSLRARKKRTYVEWMEGSREGSSVFKKWWDRNGPPC